MGASAPAAGEEVEVTADRGGDLRRGERVGPGGNQLDCQGYAGQLVADRVDGGGEPDVGHDLPGALKEKQCRRRRGHPWPGRHREAAELQHPLGV